MSQPLVPDLFATCKVLTGAILWVVQQILLALGAVIPPLKDLGNWLASDPVVSAVTWLVVMTVMLLWAVLINLLTMMWVERKFYSRLQDRYGRV